MYFISKRFGFSASHVLHGLPNGHPCSRLHGHNYEVEVVFRAPGLDAVGFVLDYRELDRFKQWLDRSLDHRHLNDVMGENPTAENLAALLYKTVTNLFPTTHLAGVRVKETDKTMATFQAESGGMG